MATAGSRAFFEQLRAAYVLLLAVALCLRCASAAAATPSLSVFVSPTGSDAADGSLASPFRTIARAKQAVAALQQQPATAARPITVFLRAGRYALTEPLEFSAADSGVSPQAPVTYQAYCDAAVEAAGLSVLAFPYQPGLVTATTTPRLLWNGVGDQAAWGGPADPFLQLGINRSSNALLAGPVMLPAPSNSDASSVCVDKNGLGHTCYADPALAPCVTGCMAACALHLERKVFADALYRRFSHLFGKDLRKEEDCVETCALSCRGCERVTLSGAVLIPAGAVTTWTLFQTLVVAAVGGGGAQRSLRVFRADLAAFLPAPASPDTAFSFSTLYVNDTQYPLAGFPDCLALSPSSNLRREFNCSLAPAKSLQQRGVATTLTVDTAAFSAKLELWANPRGAVVDLRPNASEDANLLFSLASVDATKGELVLAAGGAELSYDIFENGPAAVGAGAAAFRVENVFEELDAPGEWFFDPATKMLFVIPLDSDAASVASMANSALEIPVLRQLVRVSGSRENTYTAAAHASSSLVETDSTARVANLRFRHLVFSGTQLRHTDIYERIPGSAWPMARVAAVFLETVENIVVEHCAFEKVRGNAILVSGESDRVQLVNNNVSFVGSSGIALLARRGVQRNAFRQPVRSHLLYSRDANVSFNQIHHVGRRVAQSAAIMSVGARQTLIQGNLIYALPTMARSYVVKNANGAAFIAGTPLIRPIAAIAIPLMLAQNLATAYTVTVPVSGFDIPVVAKLVGAPECGSGSGRVGALYGGEPEPFTYTSCSGCCSVHANAAKIRVVGSSVAWADATAREVVLRPGESLELSATSSALFNSIVDVYVGFHVVTPNQILELETRATWRILTRKCQYAERTYTATCSGPCSPCGNSNGAVQQNGRGLRCDAGYEADVYSHECAGPFEAWRDCEGSGIARSHIYYDCSIKCFTTSCT
ncbi:hypothetical protein PybrP1_000843 [[Pythium] brassicae (nom. inval.)]|nr:hypothetical protein PybrP1_000843 [[Pythium] brassicae (nom. inval.)]